MVNCSASADYQLQPKHRQNQKTGNPAIQITPLWQVYRIGRQSGYSIFFAIAQVALQLRCSNAKVPLTKAAKMGGSFASPARARTVVETSASLDHKQQRGVSGTYRKARPLRVGF